MLESGRSRIILIISALRMNFDSLLRKASVCCLRVPPTCSGMHVSLDLLSAPVREAHQEHRVGLGDNGLSPDFSMCFGIVRPKGHGERLFLAIQRPTLT